MPFLKHRLQARVLSIFRPRTRPQNGTFYQIARNYQTRSLNVDACSVFFYGVLREKPKVVPVNERSNTQVTLFDFNLEG